MDKIDVKIKVFDESKVCPSGHSSTYMIRTKDNRTYCPVCLSFYNTTDLKDLL